MDHKKIITAVAKKALTPLGLRRDGKSRVWYDDHGWWAIVVELQPSSSGRGSYLNVGLSWMLYEQSHWAFDIGYREEGFRPAIQEQQFEAATEAIASHASRCVQRYREDFASPSSMYSYYRGLEVDPENWTAGIVNIKPEKERSACPRNDVSTVPSSKRK